MLVSSYSLGWAVYLAPQYDPILWRNPSHFIRQDSDPTESVLQEPRDEISREHCPFLVIDPGLNGKKAATAAGDSH